MSFRAGDVIIHKPSGDTWTLACDEENRAVVCVGWPESFAAVDDCELVERATDEARAVMLGSVAGSCVDQYRGRLAKRQWESIPVYTWSRDGVVYGVNSNIEHTHLHLSHEDARRSALGHLDSDVADAHVREFYTAEVVRIDIAEIVREESLAFEMLWKVEKLLKRTVPEAVMKTWPMQGADGDMLNCQVFNSIVADSVVAGLVASGNMPKFFAVKDVVVHLREPAAG